MTTQTTEYVDTNQKQSPKMTINTWFSATELLGVGGLPTSLSGIYKHASIANWKKRQRSNVQGVTFEYHVSSFPLTVQLAIERLALEQECSVMPRLCVMPDDTMCPTIPIHSQLAVTYLTRFINDGLYVVEQGNELTVRRIYKLNDQQYKLSCDNTRYLHEINSNPKIIAYVNQLLLPI
ncbi:hypothetical protein TUM4438_39570 [Shewanella sairae]|uniref:HTH Mu-type domain-containing protein n=1 Tax=Shewanella sairae TaxID=190310 RepID=A0ABQ4PQ34_9GAMM|nr:DNA-binding protein [Shewanella sairae]MCL1132079.1 hypothetical protein [Shewanella sairae]GIU51116.1 hypothetical protein TUM4438_39570 [Shewanella sairae]